jgi:hypothetical protein
MQTYGGMQFRTLSRKILGKFVESMRNERLYTHKISLMEKASCSNMIKFKLHQISSQISSYKSY